MRSRRRSPAVPLLAVLLLVSACGSTVATGSQVATNGGTGSLGLGGQGGDASTTTGDGSTGSSGSVTPAGSTGVGSSGTAGSSSGTSGGTGSSGSSTSAVNPGGASTGSTGSAPGSVKNGPGVTSKEIKVGLVYDTSAGAVNTAAGAGGLDSGDSKADANAVIADINKHGGVAGRKLVPVYADVDETSTQTLDQQFAAVCQTFTRDDPVFAVDGSGPESYINCIHNAGLPMLDDDFPTLGQAQFSKWPNLIEQGFANVDRLAAFHVGPLVAQKYFTPWNTTTGKAAPTGKAVVGVLTYNDTVFSHASDTYLVPSLKRAGYVPVVVKVAKNQTASDVSSQAAAVKSAQLTFASRGVTHVLIFEANAGLTELFLQAARSQEYFPRYGFASSNGPQALLTAGLMTAQQAHGSVGYGWFPNIDLVPAQNPDNGKYATPLRRTCAAVMKAAGISFASSNAQGVAYIACTDLYIIKAALDTTPQQVTLSTFLSGVASLGQSFQPAGGLGPISQTFKLGRNDPQDSAYDLSYNDSLGCFVYTGSRLTIA